MRKPYGKGLLSQCVNGVKERERAEGGDGNI